MKEHDLNILTALPIEILVQIIEYCSVSDLRALLQTSKNISRICKHNMFWRERNILYFPERYSRINNGDEYKRNWRTRSLNCNIDQFWYKQFIDDYIECFGKYSNLQEIYEIIIEGDVGRFKNYINNKKNSSRIRYLLENHNQGSYYRYLPYILNIAAERGYEYIVRELIKLGGIVNYSDTLCEEKPPLYHAIKNGHDGVIEALLQNGAIVSNNYLPMAAKSCSSAALKEVVKHVSDVNLAGDFRNQHILNYTNEKHKRVIDELIMRGADVVKLAVNNNDTPIHFAAGFGYINVLGELLNQGVNVDSFDSHGDSPLLVAINASQVESIRFLLSHGADVNYTNGKCDTPLLAAIKLGSTEIVSLLLNNNADINFKREGVGNPLHVSLFEGHLDITEQLISHGADINNAVNIFRLTPLHIASGCDYIHIVRKLIENGAKLNALDIKNRTPLHHASAHGSVKVVDELINKGADISIASQDELRTALHLSAIYGHYDIVIKLLHLGAKHNSQDKYGSTPLYLASKFGHINIVKELINYDADINIATFTDLMSPLHIAADCGHTEIVKILLLHGADINFIGNHNITALYLAIKNSHIEVINELINNGADVNVIVDRTYDERKCTPLLMAVMENQIEVVRLLLNHGANVNIANKEGSTPILIALENGYMQIANALFLYGSTMEPNLSSFALEASQTCSSSPEETISSSLEPKDVKHDSHQSINNTSAACTWFFATFIKLFQNQKKISFAQYRVLERYLEYACDLQLDSSAIINALDCSIYLYKEMPTEDCEQICEKYAKILYQNRGFSESELEEVAIKEIQSRTEYLFNLHDNNSCRDDKNSCAIL